MALKLASYVDEDGRYWRTFLPADAPDADAEIGVPAGPVSLQSLGLPEALEIRLHNELYNRGLFEYADLRRDRRALQAALMAALQVDSERLMALFSAAETEAQDGSARSSEGKPDARIHAGRSRRTRGRRALSRAG